MDEPPPPGLEPEAYYAPAPQVAPAPIPTVYQPPPVPYIPPHPNPPIFEAPAVVQALKEPLPEPSKPRVPKASVSVLQGGRKLALSSQKSNLASRVVARSSKKSQKATQNLKHATLRSDGQPNADAVFAASPPPHDYAADVSPAAEIPEPVAAYPAHLERRSRSGSPRRHERSVPPLRRASPPAKRKPLRSSASQRTSPSKRPMTQQAGKAALLSQSDEDSDIDDRLLPTTGKPSALHAPPHHVFPTGTQRPRLSAPAVNHSPSPSPTRVTVVRAKPVQAAHPIKSVSRSPPRVQPAPYVPPEQPSESKRRVTRRQLSEDDDEDDIAAITMQSSPGRGAAAKRRFRPRPSRSPQRHVTASPVASRSPSPAPRHKRLRAVNAHRSRSPAAPPAHPRSPPLASSPPRRGPAPYPSRYPDRSPPAYEMRVPGSYPPHGYHKSPRGQSAGMDLRFRERERPWPSHGAPPGHMHRQLPQAWPPPHGPPRHMQHPRSHSHDLRRSQGHQHPPRSRSPSSHAPRPGPARGSGCPRSYSPPRQHHPGSMRAPPRSASPGRSSHSPPRRSPLRDQSTRSRSPRRDDGPSYKRTYSTRTPDRSSLPPAGSLSPRHISSQPADGRRSISCDPGGADGGGSRRPNHAAAASPRRSSPAQPSPGRRAYSAGPANPQAQSPHGAAAKARGRGAFGMRSAGAWRRSMSPRQSFSRSRSPQRRSPMPQSGPPPSSHPRRSTSPARGPSPARRAPPLGPRDTPSRADHSHSQSPHMHELSHRRRRGWDMSEGAPVVDERSPPRHAALPERAPHQAALQQAPQVARDLPVAAAARQPSQGAAPPPVVPALAAPMGPDAATVPAASPATAAAADPAPAAVRTPKKPPAPLPHLHARRLQITGAPVSASAPELERLLNRAMRASGLSTAPGAPVVSASVRPADRSAHLEFATPADAANAFALDGLMCRGMRLRFQRPPTFDLTKARQLGPVEPQREQLNLERISIVVDLLNNFPTRALADRLPTDMPADSVRTALQAVPGVMAATILDLDPAGAPLAVAASAVVDASSATAQRKPEGRSAVVDISSVASLDAVLRSLNMLRIGGHPVAAARMAAPVEVVNSLQALEDEHDAHLVATIGADGEGGTAGVRLKDMLSREAVEAQAAALRHDIGAVARRYGDLLAVRLPEAAPATAAATSAVASPTADGGDGLGDPAADGEPEGGSAAAGGMAPVWQGDVLLSYRSVEAAERAAAALQGRVFDGRPIVAAVEEVH